MEKTIYRYRDRIENDLLISQGDIFCNLPYLTYDHLIRSSPDILDKFQNEKDEIFASILKNGGQIQVEGFIDAHWGILASQDCDIRPNKDLIFFPLELTKPLIESHDILNAIDINIKNTTRRLYLPKITPPNGKRTYGPFEIIFHNPFNVPYNLIVDNIEYCWRARIIEQARKIFIGKLSHFYSRIPIEEIIFLENREITKYFTKNWKDFWGYKKDLAEKFQEKINRVSQVRDVLKLVGRQQDMQNIFYYDLELLTNLKRFLEYIGWFENADELINKCKETELNVKERPDVSNSIFKYIINEFIIQENSFLDKWKEFFRTNESNIKKIRIENKKILGIFPDDKLETDQDYVKCANKTFKAKDLLGKFPPYLKNYSKLFNNNQI
ncbi:MAG: hypothetical protein ACFFDF_18130 [Candidatus Odinarchaeota archaeon]